MSASAIDVSVIIPAHNAERYICYAVDSALQQTGVTVEVIVVDNCSTDQTRAVAERKYGSSVKVVSEPRLGCCFARNAGVRLAAGKYVALLDADDVWLPEKSERQIAELASYRQAGLAYCHGQEFYDSDLTEQQRLEFTCRAEPYPFLLPTGLMAARTTFREIGDFPDVPAGEFIAWCGWAQSLGFSTFVLPDVLARRRVHPQNTSRAAHFTNGYLHATKWLMDQRRRAQQASRP